MLYLTPPEDSNQAKTVALTTIPFADGHIATWEKEGHFYFSPRHACEDLGIAWPRQFTVLTTDPKYADYLVRSPMVTEAGLREIIGLNVDAGHLWLCGINIKRVKEEVRERLILYQLTCMQVLADYWKGQNPVRALGKFQQAEEVTELIEIEKMYAKALGIPMHTALANGIKEVQRVTGFDLSERLLQSSYMENISEEDVMLEPSDIGKRIGISGYEVNKRLAWLGLQTRENAAWVPSVDSMSKGLASRHAWVKGGKSGYNFKWKLSIFAEAL